MWDAVTTVTTSASASTTVWNTLQNLVTARTCYFNVWSSVSVSVLIVWGSGKCKSTNENECVHFCTQTRLMVFGFHFHRVSILLSIEIVIQSANPHSGTCAIWIYKHTHKSQISKRKNTIEYRHVDMSAARTLISLQLQVHKCLCVPSKCSIWSFRCSSNLHLLTSIFFHFAWSNLCFSLSLVPIHFFKHYNNIIKVVIIMIK